MTTRIDVEIDAYHIARAMSWNYHLEQFEQEALVSILATYDAARAGILAEFARRYQNITDWRSVRLEDVLGEVEAMTAGVRQTLTDQYGAMATTVGTASVLEASAALSLGGLIQINNVGLSSAQFQQFFSKMPISGRLLDKWVDASFSLTVQEQLRQAINIGVIKGEGYKPIVDRLQDGYAMARTEATTLTRTFISAANNAAREETYKENSDIVKSWKWITAGDNLVCMMCLPLHGRTFPLGSGPPIPRHPKCRCTSVPVSITWRELGINVDEFEAEADKWIVRGRKDYDGEILVNPVGTGGGNPILRISQHKDADSWFQNLSDAEKRSTGLGPGRLKLLDEGKIKITDLIDSNFKVRTLNELQNL